MHLASFFTREALSVNEYGAGAGDGAGAWPGGVGLGAPPADAVIFALGAASGGAGVGAGVGAHATPTHGARVDTCLPRCTDCHDRGATASGETVASVPCSVIAAAT